MPSFEAWAPPVPEVHPRIWVTPSTLAALQARAAGSHAAFWAEVVSWAQGAMAGPRLAFDGVQPEDLGALALASLIDPARAEFAARAAGVALFLADLPIAGGQGGRDRALALAMVYDWAYPLLDPARPGGLRRRIAEHVESLIDAAPFECFWGGSLSDSAAALTALAAILSDGTPDENALWSTWADKLFDRFSGPAGNRNTFLASLSTWGDTDGGIWSGSGPGSFTVELEGALGRLLPAVQSAFAVGWEGEPWWKNLIEWLLWHWRGDRTLHPAGEDSAPAPHDPPMPLHPLPVTALASGTLGKNARWLFEEIQARGAAGSLSRGAWIWPLLWWNPDTPSERPSIATTGGGSAMRYFDQAGKLAIRDGWDEAGYSLTLEAPKYFLGGRERRRAGHFNLAGAGIPLLYEKGHLDPAQDLTPKDPLDPAQTGHRYSYAQRIPAANVVRIYASGEPAAAVEDSFQRLPLGDTRYGVLQGDGTVQISNDGGQRCPKSTDRLRDHPQDLAALIGEPKWLLAPWVQAALATSKYGCAVLDLRSSYGGGKCARYRRSILWVKPGAIPAWKRPVVLVFDDVQAPVDATKGKLTQVLQLQGAAVPTGTSDSLRFDRSPGRLFARTLKPVSIEKTDAADFTIEGVSYPATGIQPFDDPGGVRTELNPAAAAGALEWLQVLFPCPVAVGAAPTVTLIDTGTDIGATIAGIACTVKKASPFTASVGSSADVTAPAAPTGLAATARAGCVDLDWADNAEADLESYQVFRATGGGYTLIAEGIVPSKFRDETVSNGTAYQYKVAAVDTSGNVSSQSSSASATPAVGIQGPALVPHRGHGGRARAARERREAQGNR